MYQIVLIMSLAFCLPPPEDIPEIKGLVWNRYVTNNFTILSIEDEQGYWMKNNIEGIKSWCLGRWGLPDIKFSRECRVFCVPDSAMLKKLFDLDSSKFEVRRKGPDLEITAMWLALDDKPSKIIPSYLSQVALSEFESINKIKLPFWCKVGISRLNRGIPEIKSDLTSIDNDKLFDMSTLMNTSEEQFSKLSAEKMRVFSSQSELLCLFIRKEFGEVRLHSFMKENFRVGSDKSVTSVLGFTGHEDMERTYLRYVRRLSSDIKNNITPDSYLEINKVAR
jgi:hypothetical protein